MIPVALLTFADAAGAMIGTRWGRHKFATLEGTKSVEGSIAVGVTGMLATMVPLMLAGHGLGGIADHGRGYWPVRAQP
ncbi:MAG: hypothetical protein U1F61_09700 [Opitutaceae bacterium]